MTLDWLSRYLDPDTQTAFETVHHGWGCSIVTDSRCVLSVADPAATFAEPVVFASISDRANSIETAERKNTIIRGVLSEPVPPDATRTNLFDLWAWLDRFERVRCHWCGGTGNAMWLENGGVIVRDESVVPCTQCDGKGWSEPDPQPYPDVDSDTVTICGIPVCRNRLAYWLAGELEEYGTDVVFWRLRFGTNSEVSGIIFAGNGWRLVCSAMHQDFHPARYRQYLPGAGAWWQHRKCPTARLVASDWAGERGADVYDVFGELAFSLPPA